MARGKNEERKSPQEQEFLRQVDAMLAGWEIGAGEDAGGEDVGDAGVTDDLRGTVEFARKLVDLDEGPTPEFSQRLKSRLLIKLTEQDEAARAKAEGGWLPRLLSSPVWRSAAVSLVLVVAVATVLWRTGMFTGTATLDTQETEAVTGQAIERAMVPEAAGDMAVEESADGAVAVAEMAESTAEPAAELAAAPAEMAVAGDSGMAVVVGDVVVELLRSQVSARGIDIEVAVTYSSAVSADEVVAWYSVDGGPRISAADSTSRYLVDEDATRVSWAGLDLASSDATTLTFTIDRIGDQDGPWVFEIPLRD